ncbi:putative transposon, En/Spm-like protein [Tanacetum coccineum]
MITLDGGGFTHTKPYIPKWIESSYWEGMIDRVWNNVEWKMKTKSRRVNQLNLNEASKHCAGSITIAQHKRKLAAYKEAVVAKYGPSPYNHPIFDLDLWEYCFKEMVTMLKRKDREWMYNMADDGYLSKTYCTKGQSSTLMEDDGVDGCTQMVMDAMGPTIFNTASFEPISNSNSSNEQAPNPSAKGFYDMLDAADEPLWDGYAAHKENFIMKAVLLWMVSDFPTYATLSGWRTHGKLACPYCMGNSRSFQLEHGGKPCWFDCHQINLPSTHPYRKDKRGFIAGNVVLSGPPLELNGDQKNMGENLFNTIMGTAKMKDNVKARKNVKKYCNRAELHIRQVGTKDMKLKESYTLTKPQVGKICEWLTRLKFPDGYASNLGGCVSLEDQTFHSFKSHECHVFMQRLLPIDLRGMIPNSIWDVITELSTFFRAIYARVLHTSDLILLQ